MWYLMFRCIRIGSKWTKNETYITNLTVSSLQFLATVVLPVWRFSKFGRRNIILPMFAKATTVRRQRFGRFPTGAPEKKQRTRTYTTMYILHMYNVISSRSSCQQYTHVLLSLQPVQSSSVSTVCAAHMTDTWPISTRVPPGLHFCRQPNLACWTAPCERRWKRPYVDFVNFQTFIYLFI